MNLELTAAREIDAPLDRIWEILSDDFTGVGRWASNIKASRPVAGKAESGLGAERICEVPLLGSTHEVVVDWKDQSTIAYSTTAEKQPAFVVSFIGRFTLLDVGGRTRVAQTLRAELAGVTGALGSIPLRMKMRRAQRAVLKDLDALATTGSISAAKKAKSQ
jgi:carbon monoxide dehydrogenase subunit G